jgi:hypothetical protein
MRTKHEADMQTLKQKNEARLEE